jgi:outer membrane protein W
MKTVSLSFLLLLGLTTVAAAQMPYRLGVQIGLVAEQSEYRWVGNPGQELTSEHNQNGLIGVVIDYTLADRWQLEFSPRYGQRNNLTSAWDMLAGVGYSFSQGEVDYLSIPILLRYYPFSSVLVRPYIAGGIEFGLNFSDAGLQLTEFRFSEEPPFDTTIEQALYLNQLFGGTILEAGIDVQASASWSVLLGVRFLREWTPLLEDEAFTWETPQSWQVRLALMYSVGF